MREIDLSGIEAIVTDIPYGVVSRPTGGIRVFEKDAADIETFSIIDFVSAMAATSAKSVYSFCSTEQVSELRGEMVKAGYTTRLCIWEKTNPSPVNGQHLWLSGVECCVFGRLKGAVFNEHCKNTVWRFPCGRSKTHPTEKPVALFEKMILASTSEGHAVLDCCMGSGACGVACASTDRRFIGIELDQQYFANAKSRVTQAYWTRQQFQ